MSRHFDGLLALAMGKDLKMAANWSIIVINAMMVARKLQNISFFRLKQCENRLKCKQKFTKITQKTRGAEPKGATKDARDVIVVNSSWRSCSGVVFACNLAKITI